MADSLTMPRITDHINVDDPTDLASWALHFGVTMDQLNTAISKVGTAPARVERELQRR
jgi:hypothetical protein